ncbi:MAG: DUF523 domain-containing protein [Proteobacteria bacterium]|nr:DUF523 domain-containing protein [Pseudomonadota bacterium]
MINHIKIAVSSCLLGENVRYDGNNKFSRIISDKTPKHIKLVRICPEVAIGLGVPRSPIKLIRPKGLIKLVQYDNHSIDHSHAMEKFVRSLFNQFKQISGYILMEKSPSCGLASTRVYDQHNKLLMNNSAGLFTLYLRKTLPLLPMIESVDFENLKKREGFFTDVSSYVKTGLRT